MDVRLCLGLSRMSRPPRLLWVISFHHACNDGTLMALVALIPILVDVMGISYYEVGLLGFALLITVAVQYAVGRFADRVFSRHLLELGALLMGTSFLLMLLVNEFVGLFLAVAVMRVGGSFYHPVGTSWITREYEGDYLETALGVQSGVGNLGVIIALGTSGFLGEAFGWRAPCLLWAGLNFTAVLMGVLLIKDTSIRTRVSEVGRPASSVRTLSKIWPLVLPIVAGGALYQITSYFGPLNLTDSGGWSAGMADSMFAVWIGVGTITSYMFGRMSAAYGRTRLLIGGYAVSAAGVGVLALSTDWFIVGPTLMAYGALLFVTYPALFAFVSNATTLEERGTAFGMLFGFQLGGGAACVYLSGIVADVTGKPMYAFVIAAALALASVVAIAYASARKRNGSRSGGR